MGSSGSLKESVVNLISKVGRWVNNLVYHGTDALLEWLAGSSDCLNVGFKEGMSFLVRLVMLLTAIVIFTISILGYFKTGPLVWSQTTRISIEEKETPTHNGKSTYGLTLPRDCNYVISISANSTRVNVVYTTYDNKLLMVSYVSKCLSTELEYIETIVIHGKFCHQDDGLRIVR